MLSTGIAARRGRCALDAQQSKDCSGGAAGWPIRKGMTQAIADRFAVPSTAAAAEPTPLVAEPPNLGERFRAVAAEFDRAGAAGLLLIGAPMLGDVERRHGEPARRRCLEGLLEKVRAVADERLRFDFEVCLGEPGSNEVLVLLFRRPASASFFRTEMPGFQQELGGAIQDDGGRLFQPYLRDTGRLPVGISVELRNPQFGTETQLRRLIEAARRDCQFAIETARRSTYHELLETILDQRIYSVYEPIVEVESRTVFGYEALARGAEGSLFHSPMALFDAAEEHGLVFELDCACRQSGLRGAVDFPVGTKLFLNIRPTTIHDPSFHEDRLIETLERCELSPSDVVFEISEQESIRNFAAFREMRDYYRGLGFQFALDDTGAGYAGLEELIEVEPDYIKIDRAMVSGVDQDPARQDVLTAILQLADKMGAQVIGEGLERLEELEMLGRLGVRFGQGWLFGRPTPLRASA
jgi:EAL domain-containing protein (putative c-di-GMP-specific phosphodiesterase class I)